MKTVHFFAFYLHNLLKITDFSPRSSMNLKIQNLYILMTTNGDVLPQFQFSGSQSVFFRCAISLLQISTSASLRFYYCFYEDFLLFYGGVVQYRLNLHGYNFEFVSDVDCNTFLPRIQNFQAEKIIVSSRENFTFLTRINNIPAENQVHSGKE